MPPKILLHASLLSVVSVWLAVTVIPVAAGEESRIAVVFVQPQQFTDIKAAALDQNSVSRLGALEKFIHETGKRYIPEGMHLEITVVNIDLAGGFEPWRGPQFDHLRIVRDIYPPYIALEFRLADSRGSVVRAGKRELRDIAYQSQLVRPPDDPLRYEKHLLHDWFRSEFGSLKG
jgi:hypothetical protein